MPPRSQVSRGPFAWGVPPRKGCAALGLDARRSSPNRRGNPRGHGPAPAGLSASLKEEQPSGKLNTAQSSGSPPPATLQCEQIPEPAAPRGPQMTEAEGYVLGQSERAARRLEIQDAHFAEVSERLLDELALRPDDRVVELGCGAGSFSRR